jgi:hypothetical protein
MTTEATAKKEPQEKDKKEAVWVFDENGALFFQQHASDEVLELINHYYKFFANTILEYEFADLDQKERERAFLNKENDLLAFYALRKEGLNYHVDDVDIMNLRHARIPYELTAFGETKNKKPVFRFIYDGEEYSSLKLGAKVFEEVRKAVSSRSAVEITCMHLSKELLALKEGRKPTMQHMLSYKRRVEEKLNQRS